MSLSPSAVQAQLTALVGTYGEPTLMDRGGITVTQPVFFEPASRTVLETYLDDNTIVGLVFPALQGFWDATTGGSDRPPQVNDTFVRDGVTYAVQRVQRHRLAGTVVLISAIASTPTE